jgi:hypothetical protein
MLLSLFIVIALFVSNGEKKSLFFNLISLIIHFIKKMFVADRNMFKKKLEPVNRLKINN